MTRVASPFLQYAMTKGAIEVMSRTLAQQLGPRGITVNAVSPGVTDTDMGSWARSAPEIEQAIISTVALRRLGTASDIAEVVAFLSSPAGGWITGTVVDASGGTWLGPAA